MIRKKKKFRLPREVDDYKRMPVWRSACAACGARGEPIYNVVGLALCGKCRDHYGPTLEEEHRRGY